MKVNTRLFGEIEVAEDRIITFTQGLMGFEEYTRYTLIYNSEKKGRIMWLQCLDEPCFHCHRPYEGCGGV